MELSGEDALRLNVLLAQDLQAIRVDESKMAVHGLSEQGEAKVTLNPNCRDERYLRLVRETISGHVMGSPGGYPVFLRRWTRMGQSSDASLEKLLLLGEPEAVVAVVSSAGLNPELARRAWWAMPTADNARRMLSRAMIAGSDIGKELAAFLVEFLPFEEAPAAIMESVRLVLQPGLVSEETRRQLWKQGKRKAAYLVGFLQTLPDELPEQTQERADREGCRERLEPLAQVGNAFAVALLRVLSGPGQSYLNVVERVLAKPPNQDVVNTLLDTLAEYFAPLRPALPEAEIGTLIEDARALCASDPVADAGADPALQQVLAQLPQLRPDLAVMLCFSRLSYAVVRPVFSRSDAIGSLMRRKLEPVTTPLLEQLRILREPKA
jgi:hypothetical protein